MGRVMMQYPNMKGRKNIGEQRERDRDEDLGLFRELRKRQNERISNLLHCAAEEYEYDTNEKFSLYRIPSGKKEHGLEFLVETSKNDYDWLKTPPATPLFPSLEMEPTAPQLVVQKEIPISQPISRFAGSGSDSEASEPKAIDGKANHTNSSKQKLPKRSITPSHNRQRPSIIKNTNQQQQQQQQQVTHPATITNKSSNAKIKHIPASNTKSTTQKQNNNTDFLALNLKKSMEANEPQRKPKTESVSPSMRPRVAGYNMLELSNETPPNLRTNQRPSSTTRGRSTTRASTITGSQNPDPTLKACRPSRSPSPSVSNSGWNQLDRTKNLRSQKERFTLAAGTNERNSPRFFGSKMVEKVVNARKPGINQAERETKMKPLKYREKMRQEQGYSNIDQIECFC